MLLIFSKMLTIAVLLAVGVLIYRLGIVRETGSREISALIVNVCNPVLLVSSALTDETELTPAHLGRTLLICALIYAVLIAAGELLPRLLRVPAGQRPFYCMLTLFGNVGFIGLPVSLSIFGPGATLYVVLFNVLYNLIFYSYGLFVMSRASGKPIPFRPRSLLNAGMIACLAALAVYFFRFSLPEFLSDALVYISNCTTFLAMLVLGVSLAAGNLKQVLAQPKMYLFFLLRMLVLPILFSLVLPLLSGDAMMISTLLLLLAMPAGNLPIMLASEHGMETDTLTSGVIISTLMCLFIIPLVSNFFPA